MTRRQIKAKIEEFVTAKIHQLAAVSGTGGGKGLYAALRKGVGRDPGDLPELYGFLLQDMPEEFMENEGAPSKEEWSCYVTLTLYALHQQGNDVSKSPMNESGVSFGTALWKLSKAMDDDRAEDRVFKRLKVVASAKDIRETAYHLRQLVQLMRSYGISLDYGILAGDLYQGQFPDMASQLHLKWGQDFFRNVNQSKDKSDNNKEGETE